ncbi:MAG TPA: hypothetical protein ENN85_09885 [Methanoculleus sp.]|nr:hypothetical protein [Methanoculleus sp.]
MALYTLFAAMLKEEWRVHSALFGHLGFALLPFTLVFFAALGALMLPVFTRHIDTGTLVAIAHLAFGLMGMTIGAFGLLGREALNRRFGQASMIAYASRTFPVSNRTIMTAFFAKETLYYFCFWVLPPIIGFGIASVVLGIPRALTPLFLVSLGLSFLFGLSAVFLLSTVYAHSRRALLVLMGLLALGTAAALGATGTPVEALFPPLAFFHDRSAASLLISLLASGAMAAAGIWFVQVEYTGAARHYPNAFRPLTATLSRLRTPHFVAKDLLDLKRSEGGLGKILFSFLFPIGIIWLLLEVLLFILPGLNALAVFAILLAAFSTTIYNWLTEFDDFAPYAFFPVTPGDVIRAKLQTYLMLTIIPVATLVIAAAGFGQMDRLLPSLLAFAGLSSYAVAVVVYCAGLQPNILLYNTRTLLSFIGLVAPAMLALIFISLPDPRLVAAGIVLVLPAALLVDRGERRWSQVEQRLF